MIITFTDDAGVRWEAWEAHPTLLERRAERERRIAPRSVPDRRVRSIPGYQPGWLVFVSPAGRRRLRMIPDGWDTLDESGLRELLAKAARPSGELRW